jgi:hypothetical protein
VKPAFGSLEYAQARLHARLGRRPGEGDWRRIEVLRELPATIEALRRSALGEWVAGLGERPDAHDVEAVLRAHWRRRVEEVASWVAPEWSEALRWAGWLPELPVLDHLARGGRAFDWMDRDPVYRDLRGRGPESWPPGSPAAQLRPLGPAWTDPDALPAVWFAHWRALLPASAAGTMLESLAQTLRAHVGEFIAAQAGDGLPLRRALAARLMFLLRRSALDPVQPFVFLALWALDLERLRGELVRRAAFPRLMVA